jgi:hypothetical protein
MEVAAASYAVATMAAAMVAAMAVVVPKTAAVVATGAVVAVAMRTTVATAVVVAATAAETKARSYGGSNEGHQTPSGLPPLPVRQYENWNYCFTHGSIVDNNHTSATCVCVLASGYGGGSCKACNSNH